MKWLGITKQKYSFIKEPAVIKEWRERQMEMLRKKDEEEENARNRLKDQAAQVSREMSDCHLVMSGCTGVV